MGLKGGFVLVRAGVHIIRSEISFEGGLEVVLDREL